MAEKEPTQQTEQGHEIPVPKRGTWDRLLHKAAQVVEHDDKDAPREAHTPLPGDPKD